MASVPFQAMLGPSYTMFSPKAEIQKALNCHRQRVETGEGAGPYVLLRAPGLRPILQPTNGPGCFRGGFELNGQAVMVIDGKVLVLNAANSVTYTYPSLIVNNSKRARIAFSPVTAIIVSGGTLYRLNGGLITNIATPFLPAGTALIDIVYINTYFVAISNGTAFGWSTDDGVTWNASNFENVESSQNNLVAAIVHQEVLYLYGNQVVQPYTVGTNANAPFVEQQSGVSPFGLQAADSLQSLGIYRYWLSRNKEGSGTIYRGQGYSATPVSNAGIEEKIRQYERDFGNVDDAIGMVYNLGGQDFYQITFPSADASWRLNCSITQATGIPEWSEVAWFDLTAGLYHRHRANLIVHAFDKILVGDYANGWLYELTPDEFTDFGYPLPVIRRAPQIVQGGHKVSYDRMDLSAETGVGLAPPLWLQSYALQRPAFVIALAAQVVAATVTAAQALVLQAIYDQTPYIPLQDYPAPDTMNTLGFTPWGGISMLSNGTTIGEEPKLALRYSNNGGKSFTQPLKKSLGMPGDDPDIYYNNLGMAKDRVFQLEDSNPCKLALNACWLDAEELSS